MQEIIIGYQFFDKEMATQKRTALVDAKALPKKSGDVTIYWQNYEEAALDKPTFWYTCVATSLWLLHSRWVSLQNLK